MKGELALIQKTKNKNQTQSKMINQKMLFLPRMMAYKRFSLAAQSNLKKNPLK